MQTGETQEVFIKIKFVDITGQAARATDKSTESNTTDSMLCFFLGIDFKMKETTCALQTSIGFDKNTTDSEFSVVLIIPKEVSVLFLQETTKICQKRLIRY